MTGPSPLVRRRAFLRGVLLGALLAPEARARGWRAEGGSGAGGPEQDLAQRGPASPRERAERATEGDRRARKDRYATFADLSAEAREGEDFRIEAREGRTTACVVAPHGGGIEAGTSELARATAGDEHALYCFEGIRRTGNADLHLTSTAFDEPRGLALVGRAARVLALHGCGGRDAVAYVGGLDRELAARVEAELGAAGFAVRPPPADLAGRDRRNLCNRGATGRGVQVELAHGLRASLFAGLDPAGRARPTPALGRLAAALRAALAE